MNHTQAMALSNSASQREPTELEARWEQQIHNAIRAEATRGFVESEIRILAPPEMTIHDALTSATFIATKLEGVSFRCRVRVRDIFLDDGPAIVGDMVFPRGSTMAFIMFCTEWTSY